jgi:hypothetical protein
MLINEKSCRLLSETFSKKCDKKLKFVFASRCERSP